MKIGKLKGKGRLFLTSKRIILLNDRGAKTDQLKSFDLPLTLIFKEEFVQPLFGSNYFTGMCKPLKKGSFASDPHFKIWFTCGQTTEFLKQVRKCLHEIRENIQNK